VSTRPRAFGCGGRRFGGRAAAVIPPIAAARRCRGCLAASSSSRRRFRVGPASMDRPAPAESGRVLSVPGGIIAASHHEAQEAGDQST